MLLGVDYAVGILQLLLWLLLLAASAHLGRLAWWAWRKPLCPAPPPLALSDALPLITVQLPLRNECAVAERVIRLSAALEWPRTRLEIQVLDDSDDETMPLVDRTVAELAGAGHDIRVLRRPERSGFKAGNLASGLDQARGEFVLVLDADSQPPSDLLRRLMPALLHDPKLGFVQARWTFENEAENLLTRLQAMILTGLFAIEQARLSALGQPLQFNGTSGVWRREALDRAGGWLGPGGGASITEDLDLSYRAKMAGYGGLTLPEVTVETELPSGMAAFRTQQERWVEGAAASLVPLGTRILRGRSTLGDALSMLVHLARHSRQPLLLALALWLPFTLLGRLTPAFTPPHAWSLILAIVFASIIAYYSAAFRRTHVAPLPAIIKASRYAPALLALSVGLSLPLTLAFLRGLLFPGRGQFVRTPKRGGATAPQPVSQASLRLEALLGAGYLLLTGWLATHHQLPAAAGTLLFATGFSWVGLGRNRPV